jgi:hypothetical protein
MTWRGARRGIRVSREVEAGERATATLTAYQSSGAIAPAAGGGRASGVAPQDRDTGGNGASPSAGVHTVFQAIDASTTPASSARAPNVCASAASCALMSAAAAARSVGMSGGGDEPVAKPTAPVPRDSARCGCRETNCGSCDDALIGGTAPAVAGYRETAGSPAGDTLSTPALEELLPTTLTLPARAHAIAPVTAMA